MPTFSTLPVRLCLRSLTNVSVIARDVVDAAVEPDGRVDAVREQVAGHAAAGGRDVEPPQRRRRLAAGRREIVQSCRKFAR